MKSINKYIQESLDQYNIINENFIWDKLKQFWNWLMDDEDVEKYKNTDLSDINIKDIEYEIMSFDKFNNSMKNKIKQNIEKTQKVNTKLLNVLRIIDDEEINLVNMIYINTPYNVTKHNIKINNAINIFSIMSVFENLDNKEIINKAFKKIISSCKGNNIDGLLFSNNDMMDKSIINFLNISKKQISIDNNDYFYMKIS